MLTEEESAAREQEIDRQVEIWQKAFDRWADRKFTEFGRWTARGLLLMVFIFFIHIALSLKADDLRFVFTQWEHVG